jgi:mono/diheme cytochrome c family protein
MIRSFICTIIVITGIGFIAVKCSSNQQPAKENNTSAADSDNAKAKTDTVVVLAGINSKGVGRFNDIQLTHPLDDKMVANGQAIYESKCFACHKLTKELLVGPGWSGVTDRRTPEWVMNWITNTKVMLDKDQVAQADMALCLIRMPNQDLSDKQARDVLEFMRKNDGKK